MMKMKRPLSILLALCMLLMLVPVTGVSAEVWAEEVAITDIQEPVAGGDVVTDGLAGVPEGFDAEVTWYQYDYDNADFSRYTAATFADDSVYMLYIELCPELGCIRRVCG